MFEFVNKLELYDHKYQTYRTVKDEKYKEKFLFTIKYFVSFGTGRQPIYFMSTRFLKDKIDGVRVP